MPAHSGLRPLGLGIYIRQIPCAHVITITYTRETLKPGIRNSGITE